MSQIKDFWDRRAADPSLDQSEVTHPDVWQRWLEIEMVKRWLGPDDVALDVGCGSGYATRQFAPLVAAITGMDCSEAMIRRALESAGRPANAKFSVGDVLQLSPAETGSFDVVTTIRCLINLPSWDDQKQALQNIASVVKPGGRLIFVEGCRDGRNALDAMRRVLGLETMPTVWHNRDFDRKETLALLSQWFDVVEERGIGLYDLIARVAHPLMVAPAAPQYQARINEVAAAITLHRQACNDISRVLVLLLRRK